MAVETVMAQKYPNPAWLEAMMSQYWVGNYHQFLLDGNIEDSFLCPDIFAEGTAYQPGDLLPYRDLLINALLRSQFAAVFYYATATGLRVYRKDPKGNIVSVVYPKQAAKKVLEVEQFPLVLDDAVAGFAKDIPLTRDLIQNKNMEAFLKIETCLKTNWTGEGPDGTRTPMKVAVIVDSLDKILAGRGERTSQHLTEQVQRWAADAQIKGSGNLSIMIAENREHLPPELQADENGTFPIRVSFPDAPYREHYFRSIKSSSTILGPLLSKDADEKPLKRILQLTRGFKITDCVKIRNICDQVGGAGPSDPVYLSFFGSRDFDDDALENLVMKEKKDVIFANSKGMLQPIESDIKFDEIGGLGGLKEYFRGISGAILKRDQNVYYRETIPKGVLLAGPPGTGKTLLAKAVAHESGISLVKMGDIRSKWVGESEQNLTMVLSLLKEMAPIIVFIDEIDQAVGSRSTA